jgi:L-ascorbate metabolism protein UlaG (beta-lactamase superfamily)
MKITHYLYNAFLIETSGVKIAIDPGQCLWIFNFKSLIPKSEWPAITHLVITHGDPDHHWQSDRIAKASGAYVICGKSLTRTINDQTLVVDPRGRALTSWVKIDNLHPLDIGESVTLGRVRIDAVKTVHGPIAIPILGFTLKSTPGPGKRVGIGSMGFRITVDDTSILNLGDSVLMDEWKDVYSDVLMLPIGGLGQSIWTMDVDEALEAVKLIRPRLVIPCHYGVPLFWKRRFAVVDDQRFKREVNRLGAECMILKYGEVLTI